jgi:uncharacterized protein (TIGR00730 family)
MRWLCVFCGSSPGARPEYVDAARGFGALLASEGIGLVYGGASVGLMGAAADAALASGGEVTGVIPSAHRGREAVHTGLTDLRIVDTMHERKALMAELADGFVALPGGVGTLEELFEVWTWAQFGVHRKPCGLLDVAGYYASLLAFVEHAVSEGFVPPAHRAMLVVERDPAVLLRRLAGYAPPTGETWLDRTQV